MAEKVSTLALRVDSTQVLKAREHLEAMTKAAEVASDAARKLGAAAGSMDLTALAKSTGEAKKNAESLADAVKKLNDGMNAAPGQMASGMKTLADAARQSEQSVGKMGDSLDEAAKSIRYFNQNGAEMARQYSEISSAELKAERATQKANAERERAAASIVKEREEFRKLAGEIDPAVRALGKLDEQEEHLRRARGRGLVDPETFAAYNAKIQESRSSLTALATTTERTGMTARATAAAMRQVPAQFTDIAVSLAAGQAPLTVLLQQGGQLKDMFGGLGGAVRAMGTYLRGLVTPVNLLAVGFGTMAVAAYQGATETRQFDVALAKSGNQIGLTTDALARMSKTMATSAGTIGANAEALSKFVGTNAVQRDELQGAAAAAQAWSKATGESVDSVVQQYKRLAQDPMQASRALNEEIGHLDGATMALIISLQRAGNEEEAQAVAQRAYTKALKDRADEVQAQAGTMERAWRGVIGAAKEAWDSMLNIGRAQTSVEKLAAAEVRLEQLKDGAYERGAARRVKQVREQEAVIASLRAEAKATAESAEATARQNKIARDAAEAIAQMDAKAQQFATKEQKRTRELEDSRRTYNKALLDPSLGDEGRANLAKQQELLENGINEKYKDRSVSAKQHADAAANLLTKLNEQRAVLEARLDADTKLLSNQQMLVEYEAKFADLAERRTLTVAEKKLLAIREEVLSSIQINIELEKQVQRKEALAKLDERAVQVAQSLEASARNRREQFEREEGSFGLGAKLRQQAEAEASIRREYDRAISDLMKERSKGVLTADDYRTRVEAIRTMQTEELDGMRDHFARMDELQNDWALSFKEAAANAANSMTTSMQIAGAATNVVAQQMTSAITQFATTGEFSFKQFTASVLKGLAQIAAQAAVSQIFGAIFGAMGGGAGMAAGAATRVAPSGGGRANGGRTRPGAFHQVNERGPELYEENGQMYLMSGANGGRVIPVSSGSGSGAGSGGAPNVNVSVVVHTDGSREESRENDSGMAGQLADSIVATIDQQIQKSWGFGGVSYNSARAISGRR